MKRRKPNPSGKMVQKVAKKIVAPENPVLPDNEANAKRMRTFLARWFGRKGGKT